MPANNTSRFVDVIDGDDPLWEAVLPVLGQLRIGITMTDVRAVLESQIGQRPTFTALMVEDRCAAVAGWRLMAKTDARLVLYVDDLVVDSTRRSAGFGAKMLAEMRRRAHYAGAAALDLDSGVQRFAAHRFYLTNRMAIISHHFRLDVPN
ncbi:GNAT family N-acetyltransferase [Rarobacter incanus]|uniref:Acetyltransferase (GNAT) family protein n=1 Tax=Rarobacter incanus TaxID=153494 RepID=A0A542SNE1_9MICO|nr:GNAT family N-acetyltransferase [Rarobacter incanus]TQK76154.1 acetyltransferase (GNAT) family protein [Rarobacter incanus]